MLIVWKCWDISHHLNSIFNYQILINFCNPPLEFIDPDTRDILGRNYNLYFITLIPS
jgi:hypothetical protein